MNDQPTEAQHTSGSPGRKGALVGGLWNAAQMVLPLLGTTVLSIVLGRVLGPDLLGEQSFISYSEALLAGVLVMSLQKASLQVMSASTGAGDAARTANLARWTMLGQTLNGVVSAVILIAVGTTSAYPLAWILAGLTSLVNAIGWGYATRVIAASGSWTEVAGRRLWTQMFGQVAAAVAVLLGAGLNAVFAANLVSAVVLLALIIPLAPRIDAKTLAIPRELGRLWGLFTLRSVLVQVVGQRVEFLFLAAYSTPDQIAMYSIPFMVVTAVVLIPTSIISAGMPAMAAHEGAGRSDEVAGHLGYAVRVTIGASIPLALGLAALGPSLVVLLYGGDYQEAGQLLAWMSPLVLVLPAAVVCETYWYGRAALRIPLVTAAVGAAVDLALCFALIPRFDALGAAWANLAGQGIGAILMLAATRRNRPSLYISWSRTVITTVAMSALALAAWYATNAIGGAWGLALGVVVALLGCVAFGRIVGFVSGDDAQWLQDTLPARLGAVLPWVVGRAAT
ncbi:MAG: hypothetical protein E6Q91_02105 [Actinobacteria bacterium]|nr:MAG: hypothetical protein E6Q91_02105 [Actinomycetota bacterium]